MTGNPRPGGSPRAVTWLALGLVVTLSLLLAWQLRWALDDAFISLRYARNLAHGHGLVFNPGESPPVEGYTNPLWTVLMAVPIVLGLDPLQASFVLGLLCGAVTLVVTWHLARRAVGPGMPALLAVVLLGLNYSYLCFLTSGMETALQTCLITSCLTLALGLGARNGSRTSAVGLSICGAAALLTRLDSAVPLLVILGWLVFRWKREGDGTKDWRSRLLWILAPGGAIVIAWIIWKLSYYGELLPNTWYARETGLEASIQWSRGERFLIGFVRDYWFWPLMLPAFALFRLWRRAAWLLLMSALLAWGAYLIYCGGDYMEYRFMVPLLPALCVVLVGTAVGLHRFAAPVVVAGLVAASAAHGWSNPGTPIGHGRLGPVVPLKSRFAEPDPWSALRESLAPYPGSSDVLWTFPALGRTSYNSGFQVVDLHGLTDPWVARHGLVRNESPGHDKYAPLWYLEQRGVALAHSFDNPCYWYQYYTPEELAGRQLVRLGPSLFLYIKQNPTIDRYVAEHGKLYLMPPPERCAKESDERLGRETRRK